MLSKGNNGLDIKVGLGKENIDEFAWLFGFFLSLKYFYYKLLIVSWKYYPFFPCMFC